MLTSHPQPIANHNLLLEKQPSLSDSLDVIEQNFESISQESTRFLFPQIVHQPEPNQIKSAYRWTDVAQVLGSFVSSSCYPNRSPKYRGKHPPEVKDLESSLPDHNFSKEFNPQTGAIA